MDQPTPQTFSERKLIALIKGLDQDIRFTRLAHKNAQREFSKEHPDGAPCWEATRHADHLKRLRARVREAHRILRWWRQTRHKGIPLRKRHDFHSGVDTEGVLRACRLNVIEDLATLVEPDPTP